MKIEKTKVIVSGVGKVTVFRPENDENTKHWVYSKACRIPDEYKSGWAWKKASGRVPNWVEDTISQSL